MKVVVYHSGYGCETGCCGHTVELRDDNDNEIRHKFEFDHPDFTPNKDHDAAFNDLMKKEAFIKFAIELVKDTFGEEHVKDLDWDNCHVANYCEDW